jgi:GNAT superfamily N-acetyltransferase
LAAPLYWKISKKATINGKIVGCYLLNNTSIYEYLSKNSKFEDYKNKRGIQGMGLAVLPEFKGMGIGKKLRKIPYEMEYDYIWGRHLKSLKNIHHWIKFGRRVVFNGKDKDGKEIYITLADLN